MTDIFDLPIVSQLRAWAGQEGHDEPEHDMAQEAADVIDALQGQVGELKSALRVAVKINWPSRMAFTNEMRQIWDMAYPNKSPPDKITIADWL